jgi:hypothetical protein
MSCRGIPTGQVARCLANRVYSVDSRTSRSTRNGYPAGYSVSSIAVLGGSGGIRTFTLAQYVLNQYILP